MCGLHPIAGRLQRRWHSPLRPGGGGGEVLRHSGGENWAGFGGTGGSGAAAVSQKEPGRDRKGVGDVPCALGCGRRCVRLARVPGCRDVQAAQCGSVSATTSTPCLSPPLVLRFRGRNHHQRLQWVCGLRRRAARLQRCRRSPPITGERGGEGGQRGPCRIWGQGGAAAS